MDLRERTRRRTRRNAVGIPRRVAAMLPPLVSVALLSACTLVRGPGAAAPLAASLQDIIPHGDRDHFVYVWERRSDGEPLGTGIQVEHVTALDTPGEFEIALSEDAQATGRVRIRDDGKAIVLLTEDDLPRGIRLTYDPPLPYLEAPVRAGELNASSTANVTGLDDGAPIGSLRVTQTTQISALAHVHALLGDYTHAVAVRTVRNIQGAEGGIEMRMALVLVPGIGEISSDGTVAGAPALHRELACALVAGKPIGNCRQLQQTLKEFSRPESSDVP